MNPGLRIALVALALVGAGPLCAQEVLLTDPGASGAIRANAGGQFSLLPAGADVISTTPLFLQDPAATNRATTAAGAIGGVVANSSGPGQLSVGFEYIRPFWTHGDFTLVAPPPYGPFFPGLADIGHADNQFAFAPTVRYDYYVSDLDFAIGAAGTFLALDGRIQRDLATTGSVAGDLVATYNLTLMSVIPLQAARRFTAAELFGDKKADEAAGLLIDLSIGTRYVSLSQAYNSTIHAAGLNGVNVATRSTSQHFRGLGATAGLDFVVPGGDDWLAFLNTRGSLLVSGNDRSSNATVVVAGLPGYADSISESKTSFLPVVELEAGFEWGTGLGRNLAAGGPPPTFTVRVAGVGQYWGGMGPLSAGSTQGFKGSDLYLAGVSVTLGLRH